MGKEFGFRVFGLRCVATRVLQQGSGLCGQQGCVSAVLHLSRTQQSMAEDSLG